VDLANAKEGDKKKKVIFFYSLEYWLNGWPLNQSTWGLTKPLTFQMQKRHLRQMQKRSS
jgi:hypothetical protein